MNYFDNLILKPLSLRVLLFVSGNNGLKASDIAEALELGTRQVDAAISKSLQRYGLLVRESKLTPLKKKDYNVINITETGQKYVAFLAVKEEERLNALSEY